MTSSASHPPLLQRPGNAWIFARFPGRALQRSEAGTSGLRKSSPRLSNNPITSKASSRPISRCYLEWLAALIPAATDRLRATKKKPPRHRLINAHGRKLNGMQPLDHSPPAAILFHSRCLAPDPQAPGIGRIILSPARTSAEPEGDFGVKVNAAQRRPAARIDAPMPFTGATTQTEGATESIGRPSLGLEGARDTIPGTCPYDVIDGVADYINLAGHLFEIVSSRRQTASRRLPNRIFDDACASAASTPDSIAMPCRLQRESRRAPGGGNDARPWKVLGGWSTSPKFPTSHLCLNFGRTGLLSAGPWRTLPPSGPPLRRRWRSQPGFLASVVS